MLRRSSALVVRAASRSSRAAAMMSTHKPVPAGGHGLSAHEKAEEQRFANEHDAELVKKLAEKAAKEAADNAAKEAAPKAAKKAGGKA